MHRTLLALSLFALPALADVAPPETSPCTGKALGAECSTWDSKKPGKCVEKTFQPPPFKVKLGAKPWKALVCEEVKAPAAQGSSSRSMTPWLGVGLAFVAVAFAVSTRARAVQPSV